MPTTPQYYQPCLLLLSISLLLSYSSFAYYSSVILVLPTTPQYFHPIKRNLQYTHIPNCQLPKIERSIRVITIAIEQIDFLEFAFAFHSTGSNKIKFPRSNYIINRKCGRFPSTKQYSKVSLGPSQPPSRTDTRQTPVSFQIGVESFIQAGAASSKFGNFMEIQNIFCLGNKIM